MDAHSVKTMLTGQLEDVLVYLLPNGKRHGHYFHVGSIGGEAGDSLRVCLAGPKRGVWMDGAEEGMEGDILDLWKATKGHSDKGMIATLAEAREYLGIQHHAPRIKNRRKYEKPEEEWSSQLTDEMLDYLQDRGIEGVPEGYRITAHGHKDALAFIYDDDNSKVRMAKYLSLKRRGGKKKVWSSADTMPILYGMNAPVVQSSRYLVICEGEINAISYGVQNIPACAVPFGAKGEGSDGSSPNDEWIANCFDFLQQFDTIYLSFDDDPAGQEAVNALIPRLGRERCRIVELPEGKDANDLLLKGSQLTEWLHEAKTRDPDDLCVGSDMMNKVWGILRKGRRENQGIVPCDFEFPEDCEFRVRPREGTIITGYANHGKSNFAYQLMAWFAAVHEMPVFIGSYEEPADDILSIMAHHVTGKHLESNEYAQFRKLDEFYKRIIIHDYEGVLDWRKFFEYAYYAIKRYGVQHVLLDSASSLTLDLDDKSEMAEFTKLAQAFWKESGAHLWAVFHPRKGYNEDEPPRKQDIKGSGYVGDLFFNVITIHRPHEDLAEGCDAELIVSKQKVGGRKPHIKLNFHDESYRLIPQLTPEIRSWVKGIETPNDEPF